MHEVFVLYIMDHYIILQVITPFRSLILCAYTRKEMEEWISALKSVANKDFYEVRYEVTSISNFGEIQYISNLPPFVTRIISTRRILE